MRSQAVVIVLLTLLLAASPSLAEDKVFLKTGAVLRGRILKETEESVTIEIPDLGKIEVPRSQIERLEGGSRPAPEPTPPPTVEPPPEEKPPGDPVEIPYEEVRPGQTVLVILKGEHHGSWVDSGRRYLAEVPVLSEKRMKLVFDPEAGVEGFAWIPRDRVRRVLRVQGYPDRLILFFEGVETGSWIEGVTAAGKSFAGQLAGVSEDGTVSVWVPGDGTVETLEYDLAEVRVLSATAPGAELRARLRSVEPGEPVTFVIRGRGEVRGRLLSADRAWFVLEVADGPEAEPRKVEVFRGLPILDARLLPEEYRKAFQGLSRGDPLTVVSVRDEEDRVIRRSLTGTLVHATTEGVTLLTRDGPADIPVATIRGVARPGAEEFAALTKGREESASPCAVPVLPGMTEEEAEKALTAEDEGVDFLCRDGKVVRVFCRPPFSGPVFGIRLGTEFRKALADTDLVFDTQIDPKGGEEPRVTTMLSHTLARYVVKLYVASSGEVLAAEITAR